MKPVGYGEGAQEECIICARQIQLQSVRAVSRCERELRLSKGVRHFLTNPVTV